LVDTSALPLFVLVGALSGQDTAVMVTQFASSEWVPDTAGGNGATDELIGAMTLPRTPVISMKRVSDGPG
jgi:hypothetical protein